jgi:regulatory protein YycI of two-component signal transduction system YycFG
MNLGRAKSILIIAFVGLNIFLGYYLFWPDFGRLTQVAITAEEAQVVESLLDENNYILEVPLERAVQTSNFLSVAPGLEFQQSIRQRLIDRDASVFEVDGSIYYASENETAVFKPTGLTRISYDPGVFLGEDLSQLEQRELKNSLMQFLEERALVPEGIQFDYLDRSEPGQLTFYYYQVIDEMPVFSGQFKIVLRSDYVVEVEIYWLDPLDRVPSRKMEVISIAEALANLVRILGPCDESCRIARIDLGYYSGEYDAEKWEIPPVWRIFFDNQQFYYINAFTGNLEQDSIITEQLP